MKEDCDLTERELHAARVVGEHYAGKMRTVVVCMAVVALLAIAGNVTGWLLVSNEARNRATDIQTSRLRIIVDSCEQTNARNLDTNAKLDKLPPDDSRTATENRQGAAAAKLIVQALVPFVDDCEKAARARLTASTP